MQPQTTPTFALTPADFGRLMKVLGKRLRRRSGSWYVLRGLRVLAGACVGMSTALSARLMAGHPEIDHSVLLAALFMFASFAIVLALPYLAQRMVRGRLLSPQGIFLAPQSVEFGSNGFVITSANRRSEFFWSGVLGREEDANNFYLFVDQAQAVVIPRSSVESFLPQFEGCTGRLKNVA